MPKTTVIYHSADFDGIFCREIAKKFLPDAELIGWNFGDPLIPYPEEGMVCVLDLSPDCLTHTPTRAASSLIWIDHHKTSIEKWPKEIFGYRIDGVAACRLAWQWFFTFHSALDAYDKDLPEKQAYIDREVSEPLAVRLAGEYDIWDKRDPRAETFQYGLHAVPNIDWDRLLAEPRSDNYHDEVLIAGSYAQFYANDQNAQVCNSRTWVLEWEGLKFLCVNTARFNSLFFAAKDVPETGHDALLGFCFNGKTWTVSLYHAKHRTDLDLSAIAKKYNGGGHRGACGFTCDFPPFLTK